MGGVANALHNPNSSFATKHPEMFAMMQKRMAEVAARKERERGEGIPAATPATGAEDLGLSMDSSVTKRPKRMRGRKGLMIGSGSSGGQTTGIGLNL